MNLFIDIVSVLPAATRRRRSTLHRTATHQPIPGARSVHSGITLTAAAAGNHLRRKFVDNDDDRCKPTNLNETMESPPALVVSRFQQLFDSTGYTQDRPARSVSFAYSQDNANR